MSDTRQRRVADQIQRELSELIRLALRDPRVGMATLTGVDVSRDYAHAKVYFTKHGDDAQREACREGLNSAAGFLRREIAKRLSLRSVPALHFEVDETIERGTRLTHLIDRAVAEDAAHPRDGDG